MCGLFPHIGLSLQYNLNPTMSVNKVILLGNLGKDPEIRHFDTGAVVASFTLATTERGYTAKNGTQVPDRTDWHNIVLWGGLAEVAEKYLHKGNKVYIEGKVRTRSYTDPNTNITRFVTEIFADNMEMLSIPPQQPSAPVPPPTPTAQPAQRPAQPDYSQSDLPF
jgi:single-strand DNA-binding protein